MRMWRGEGAARAPGAQRNCDEHSTTCPHAGATDVSAARIGTRQARGRGAYNSASPGGRSRSRDGPNGRPSRSPIPTAPRPDRRPDRTLRAGARRRTHAFIASRYVCGISPAYANCRQRAPALRPPRRSRRASSAGSAAAPPTSPRHHRERLDLHQELGGPTRGRHLDRRRRRRWAGSRNSSRTVGPRASRPCPSLVRQLHDVVEPGPGGREAAPQVLEHLARLRVRVAAADQRAPSRRARGWPDTAISRRAHDHVGVRRGRCRSRRAGMWVR